MFTLNGKIQSHVDVYLTKRTMRWIANMFPYMVDTSKATGPPSVLMLPPTALTALTLALTPRLRNVTRCTGGGDVPSIRFHELEDDVTPFTVEGVTFQPLQGRGLLAFRPLHGVACARLTPGSRAWW